VKLPFESRAGESCPKRQKQEYGKKRFKSLTHSDS
jgi:hypothetical protein